MDTKVKSSKAHCLLLSDGNLVSKMVAETKFDQFLQLFHNYLIDIVIAELLLNY